MWKTQMKKLSYKQKYLLTIRTLQCIATAIGMTGIGVLALIKTGIVIM